MKNSDFKDSRLLEAFDFIDQKYIAEVADSLKFEKAAPMPAKGFNRRTWRHIAALAACVLLLGAVIPMMTYLLRNYGDIASWFPEDTTEESNPLTEPETPPEETTTLPPETTEEETTAEPETTACTHPNLTVSENMPTCTESATVQSYCSDCGYSDSKVLPPLGHDFVNGICTRCGATEENYVSIGLEYKAFGDYAVLVGIGTCTDPDIVIASEFQGLPVTEIWHEAFVGVKGMRSVKIPEGVTYIESHAFENCTDLREVYLPASLENVVGSLMTHGFVGCPAIETIEIAEGGKKYYSVDNCLIERETGTLVFGCGKSAIPADGSVKSIGEYAFNGCRNLVSLALPGGVTHIRTGAFSGCEALRTLTLPNSLVTIRQNAFENCTALSSLTLPESVTEIYNGAFRGCSKLKSVTLPSSLTLIDSEAFLGTAIESIVIPKNVKELGAAFSECVNLTSVTLPEGFESFVGHTFAGCTSLKSITLPKSLKNIGMNTFYGCTALTDIQFAGTVAQWKSISKQEHWNEGAAFKVIHCSDGDVEAVEYDGSRGLEYEISDDGKYAILVGIGTCTDKDIVVATTYNGLPVTKIDSYALYNCQFIESVVIPEGVTIIHDEAFYLCKNLKKVTLPSTLEWIQYWAFAGCESLERITIPDSVTQISIRAFSDCKNLSSLTLGVGVELIEESAFENCTSLGYVKFPKSLRLLANDAFAGCTSLTSVHYAGTIQEWNSVDSTGRDYGNSHVWYEGVPAASVCCSDGDIKLYDETEYDGSRGLEYKISDDGTYAILVGIGTCTDKNIVVASSYNGLPVTTIGECALSNNSTLKSVTISEGVETIMLEAFYRCTAISEISLPSTLRTIGSWAFAECESLTVINIPDSVKKINDRAFAECRGLTSLDLGRGVEQIMESAFTYCTSLKKVAVPGSVKEISNSAFAGCSALNDVTFSQGIEKLGFWIFSDCLGLDELKYRGTIEEWGKVFVPEEAFGNITIKRIRCSDGDINLMPEPEYDGSRGLEYEIRIDSFTGRQYAALIGIGACTDSKIVTATYYQGYPVTDIDGYAFDKISGITSITVSEGVTYIEMGAFCNCPDLRELHLPSTLMYIGNAEANIISGSNNIEVITVPKNAEYFYVDGNCLIEKKTGTLALGCKTSVIPTDGSVKEIGRCAFQSNPNIKNIVLPEGITKIDELAFAGCKNLKSILFPKSLTEIGPWAFQNCTSLEKINLTEKVTVIYYEAFHNCAKLAEVVLPGSLEKIYWSSFGLCPALNEIKYLGTKAEWNSVDIDISWNTGSAITVIHCSDGDVNLRDHDGTQGLVYKFSADGTYAILVGSVSGTDKRIVVATTYNGVPVKKIGSHAFAGNASLTEIVIPEGVTVIENEAFDACGLQKVTLPSTLEWIQDMAFARCSKLAQINIPDGVREIGQNAFKDCVNLTSLTLGAGVELIEESAFENCTSLGYVKFPKSLRLLANDAFAGCTSLTSVHYAGTIQEWNSVDSTGRDYGNSHVWYEGVPAASVCCSDGDAIIGG